MIDWQKITPETKLSEGDEVLLREGSTVFWLGYVVAGGKIHAGSVYESKTKELSDFTHYAHITEPE